MVFMTQNVHSDCCCFRSWNVKTPCFWHLGFTESHRSERLWIQFLWVWNRRWGNDNMFGKQVGRTSPWYSTEDVARLGGRELITNRFVAEVCGCMMVFLGCLECYGCYVGVHDVMVHILVPVAPEHAWWEVWKVLAKAHYLGLLGNCQSETPTMWHCGVGSEHDHDDDDDDDDDDGGGGGGWWGGGGWGWGWGWWGSWSSLSSFSSSSHLDLLNSIMAWHNGITLTKKNRTHTPPLFGKIQGKLCPWTSCVFAPPPEAWRRWPIAACTSAASARGAAICHQAPRRHGSGVTAYMDHPPGMKWQHRNPFVSWKADWGIGVKPAEWKTV